MCGVSWLPLVSWYRSMSLDLSSHLTRETHFLVNKTKHTNTIKSCVCAAATSFLGGAVYMSVWL